MMLETQSKIKKNNHSMIFTRKMGRTHSKPTLEQQLKAIDDLSNSLTIEEKREFIKVMDEMENKND